MFCCIYLTICDRQVLLKYFIDKCYWDFLTGCFYFYPIFGKERPRMILRNMSKSVLTVDCFCHPLVMLHRWLEKSRSVMLGHLKNLAASSLAISENGSVWEWPQRLRNVLSQKNSPKNLQNADAARSQTCTFTMGPGSGWFPRTHFYMFRYRIRVPPRQKYPWKLMKKDVELMLRNSRPGDQICQQKYICEVKNMF